MTEVEKDLGIIFLLLSPDRDFAHPSNITKHLSPPSFLLAVIR